MKLSIWLVTILIVTITRVLGSEVVELGATDFKETIKKGTWYG